MPFHISSILGAEGLSDLFVNNEECPMQKVVYEPLCFSRNPSLIMQKGALYPYGITRVFLHENAFKNCKNSRLLKERLGQKIGT